MVATAPHYLLLSETQCIADESSAGGFWRFVLRQIDGSDHLEVSDTEPGVKGERLQLLSVIRGLEAIGQPSHVTLVTSSQYVNRGIRRDLVAWKEMNWMWERFGELHEIKNSDLWKRLDRALQFHTIKCRTWRLESQFQQRMQVQPATIQPRVGRVGKNVLETWVHAACRIGNRQSVESLATNCM